MNLKSLHLLLLASCLTVCAGCGSGHFDHEIDVVLEPETNGLPVTECKVAKTPSLLKREGISQLQLRSPDTNGLIHFEHGELSVLWVWQSRPSYISFGFYVPEVSTNGYFWFTFSENSRLPWRGLKRGNVDVQPRYFEFDRPNGWHNVPAVSAKVKTSPRGGYLFELHLPEHTLREGVASEFVPYEH